MILNNISNTYSRGDVYSDSSSHWRHRNMSSKVKLLLSHIKMCGWSNSFIVEDKMWLVHKCFSLFQCNFSFGKMVLGTQALPRNREAHVGNQNWHKSGFVGQPGRTGQTGHTNWSYRSGQICQIVNWTSPLHISRRNDPNTCIERPIWTPDEEVMPPGRPAIPIWPVRPVQGGQTGDQSDRSEKPNLS